jgi:hypothetical protein
MLPVPHREHEWHERGRRDRQPAFSSLLYGSGTGVSKNASSWLTEFTPVATI